MSVPRQSLISTLHGFLGSYWLPNLLCISSKRPPPKGRKLPQSRPGNPTSKGIFIMLVNTRKCKPHSPVPELGPFRIPHSKDPERIPFPEKARSYLFRGSIPSVRAGRHGVQQYTIISLGKGESNLLSTSTVPFFELAGEVNNSQLSGTGKICTSGSFSLPGTKLIACCYYNTSGPLYRSWERVLTRNSSQ